MDRPEAHQHGTVSQNGCLSDPRSWSIAPNSLLAIALVVASLIWGIRIGERELWHDEVYTLLEARGIGYGAEGPQQGFTANELDQFNSFPRVLRACVFMDSGNGTAYVSMIHIWSALFGTSPVALRSWSMVLALLSVFMLYRLGNLLFPGRWVAACAALLLACSPLLFTMAIDARSYMQALFLTILATLLLFRLMKEERPGRGLVFLYGTVAGLALLSHYSSCYIIAAHPLVALQQRTPWGRIARILPAGVVAVGMVLTWLFNGGFAGLEQMSIYNQYYVDQLKEQPDLISFYSATSPRSLVEGWGVQLLWASGNGLQFAGPRLRSVLLLLVIPVALVLLVLRTASAQKDKRTMGSLLILAVSSMLYATILALTSGHTVSFQAKYAVFSLPYLALAMAWAAEIAFRERGPSLQVARAAAMLGVVIVAASLVLAMNAPSPIGPDRYQEYNTSIVKEMEQAPDAEVVLVHSSWTAAYLCAIYSEGSARSLKHFVKPDLNAITGLFVNGHADEGFEVIRAQDPRFSRSQPHDDPTWQLNNDSLPNLPAFAPVQGTTH